MKLSLLRNCNHRISAYTSRRLSYEQFEDRRLLAISWANAATADFSLYRTNEVIARELVNRAISDWGQVISGKNKGEKQRGQNGSVENYRSLAKQYHRCHS
jgi:hypothetical protein